LEVIGRLDDLLSRLTEADHEKLSFAIRQTVKQVTLRRERRKAGRHRITIWDGVIELRDDLGVTGVIPLTDDDIPSPGRWREAAQFVRQRHAVVRETVRDILPVRDARSIASLGRGLHRNVCWTRNAKDLYTTPSQICGDVFLDSFRLPDITTILRSTYASMIPLIGRLVCVVLPGHFQNR